MEYRPLAQNIAGVVTLSPRLPTAPNFFRSQLARVINHPGNEVAIRGRAMALGMPLSFDRNAAFLTLFGVFWQLVDRQRWRAAARRQLSWREGFRLFHQLFFLVCQRYHLNRAVYEPYEALLVAYDAGDVPVEEDFEEYLTDRHGLLDRQAELPLPPGEDDLQVEANPEDLLLI